MHALSVAKRVILQQRLNVFPTAQATNLSQARHFYRRSETITRRIPENRALHMRRLHLASGHLQSARVVNEGLRDIHALTASFTEAQSNVDAIVGGRLLDAFHFGAIYSEAVLDVFDARVEVDGACPDPCWIAWDPAFRESNELSAGSCGFCDESACLFDTGFEV